MFACFYWSHIHFSSSLETRVSIRDFVEAEARKFLQNRLTRGVTCTLFEVFEALEKEISGRIPEEKAAALAYLQAERRKGSQSHLSETYDLFQEISEQHPLVGSVQLPTAAEVILEDHSPDSPLEFTLLSDSQPNSPRASSPHPSSPGPSQLERSPSGQFSPRNAKLRERFRLERQVSERRQGNEVNLSGTVLGADLALQRWEEKFRSFLVEHRLEAHTRIQDALSSDWIQGGKAEPIDDLEDFSAPASSPSFQAAISSSSQPSQTLLVSRHRAVNPQTPSYQSLMRTVRFSQPEGDLLTQSSQPLVSQPTPRPTSRSFATPVHQPHSFSHSQPTPGRALSHSQSSTPAHPLSHSQPSFAQPTPRSGFATPRFASQPSQPSSQLQTPQAPRFLDTPVAETPSQMLVRAASAAKKNLLGSQSQSQSQGASAVKKRKTGF